MIFAEGGTVQAAATRELIQPCTLESFRTEGVFFNHQQEVFQELHRKIGGGSGNTGIVLHSGMVLVKKFPIALAMDEDLIHKQLSWEASQLLIGPMDEYVIEYERIPFQSPEGNPFYVMILVRKSVVRALHKQVQKLDLTLRDVDIDVFCHIRTLLANYPLKQDETSIIADIQNEEIILICIKNKEYYFSHRVPLRDQHPASKQQPPDEIVHIMMKELKRLIFGYKLGRSLEDMHLYLVGGDSVQPVAVALTSTVSAPVEIVNPFVRLMVSNQLLKQDELEKFPEKYSASVGIALKRAELEMISIN